MSVYIVSVLLLLYLNGKYKVLIAYYTKIVMRDNNLSLVSVQGTNGGQKCGKDKHNKRKYDSQNSLFKLYISDFISVFYN